ncbi:RimJ/RimL family protein N-acetyltransferase [Tamaricihabitans halophyticus]|uniref:RimJ/RimL family protein N-acetyltransferase n=1 Tax=Tamaricihabitans halophyticus TaxID=1262583 RepID=A0A4V2SUN6_9PSEU|nr:GNAT family protein [Tamaricihabitans halophyticus]TCP55006.1 RimJ/RimL family protein N-acetyltransferase [Tamaricihabitans halophyticus]
MTQLTLPLTTDRLLLRPHEKADTSPLQRIYARPDVARFLLEEPWTAEDAIARVDERLTRTDLDGESEALALVIEYDSATIGDIALWFTDKEHRMAEIGWVLDPEFGGQGFATEAVHAVLEASFEVYGLHRVSAQMDARNTASARLASKVGMRREAHLRQNWWSKGEWTDTLVFAMLASDRPQRTAD